MLAKITAVRAKELTNALKNDVQCNGTKAANKSEAKLLNYVASLEAAVFRYNKRLQDQQNSHQALINEEKQKYKDLEKRSEEKYRELQEENKQLRESGAIEVNRKMSEELRRVDNFFLTGRRMLRDYAQILHNLNRTQTAKVVEALLYKTSSKYERDLTKAEKEENFKASGESVKSAGVLYR